MPVQGRAGRVPAGGCRLDRRRTAGTGSGTAGDRAGAGDVGVAPAGRTGATGAAALPGQAAAGGRRCGQCREPCLLALPVQGIHPGGLQRHGGVPQRGQLADQDCPLGGGLGHRFLPVLVGAFGVGLAGLRGAGSVVGGAVRVGGGVLRRPRGGSGILRGLEGTGAAGGHRLERGGLLERLAVSADQAERRCHAAITVEVAGELADQPAGFFLLGLGGGGLGVRQGGGVPPGLQFHQGVRVGVVGGE